MKVDVKLPFVQDANDYHQFAYIKDLLKGIGIRVSYIEVPDSYYEAVFYRGRLRGSEAEKLYKKLVKEYKKNNG
jgi:effector-binding domain-containing protein